MDSYLHEPVRALLARLDAISAASDAVVDAGPADMFSAEASEGHVIRCVIDGHDVVRGVYPVPEPVMVPWADARPGMVLVDRDADGEITGVAQVSTCTDDGMPEVALAWQWAWSPLIEWNSGETLYVSDGWQVGHYSDAVRGERINIGGADLATEAANVRIAPIVRHQQDDIGAGRGRSTHGGKRHQGQRHRQPFLDRARHSSLLCEMVVVPAGRLNSIPSSPTVIGPAKWCAESPRNAG